MLGDRVGIPEDGRDRIVRIREYPHSHDVGQSPTAGELADELADRVIGFFGSAHATPEQEKELSRFLIRQACRWVNKEFDLGIPEGESIHD